MSDPSNDPPADPARDPVYRGIMAVLAASVIVGALAALAGETVFGSRALANAGLGMAVVCLALYWILRLRARRLSRQLEDQQDGEG